MPKDPVIVQGHPTVPCKLCTKPTSMLGTALCDGCWHLNQAVTTRAVALLRDPKTAPAARQLLEQALATPLDPPKESA